MNHNDFALTHDGFITFKGGPCAHLPNLVASAAKQTYEESKTSVNARRRAIARILRASLRFVEP